MSHSSILALFALFALVRLSVASFSIPSLGLDTAPAVRSGLRDRDFRINFSRATQVNTPTFTASIADLANFPALAGQDVQSTIVKVSLKAGQPFFSHLHPRGTETLNALQGTFRVRFRFDGLGDARVVSNVIRAGESTVFPQGLIHETVCISKTDCAFLSVLNSADPGTVPAAL